MRDWRNLLFLSRRAKVLGDNTVRRAYQLQSQSQGLLRHLIPGSPFELSSGFLLSCAAPLFEEKRNTRVQALVADFQNPRRVHGAGAGAGFAAHDNPIDAFEIQAGQRPQERFEGEKLDVCAGPAKVTDAGSILKTLDADAHPDVRTPGKF